MSTARTTGKSRPNLTLNYGLRYEINGQMNDIDNRLSAIDLTVPGGRFVIASDDARPHLAERTAAAAADPDSVRDLDATRVDRRAACDRAIDDSRRESASPGRLGDDGKTVVNAGFGVFLNQWAYSVQQALASDAAVLLRQDRHAPRPTRFSRRSRLDTMLLAPAQRHRRRQHDEP